MHFAEFLNEGFPAHLRILFLPTCVGFGTGAHLLVRSFSWQRGSLDSCSTEVLQACQLSTLCLGDLPPKQSTAFEVHFQPYPRATFCVTPSLNEAMRYRNFSLLSIAYASRLCLGPDLPRGDERCPGTFRFSVGRILTVLFATHTGILTSYPSSCPYSQPSSK